MAVSWPQVPHAVLPTPLLVERWDRVWATHLSCPCPLPKLPSWFLQELVTCLLICSPVCQKYNALLSGTQPWCSDCVSALAKKGELPSEMHGVCRAGNFDVVFSAT